MLLALTLGLAMWTAEEARPAQAPRTSDRLEEYRAQAKTTGRDAAAHVKLALWCEANGLNAERLKHLVLATLIDPNQATARGLLGYVFNQGKWRKPSDVSARLVEDPDAKARLEEYLKRRTEAPNTADGQWKLARWCEQNGLAAQATAHDRTVVRLDPRREAAWKKLGYKKQGNGWARPEDIAARKRDSEEQRQANRHWKPIVERYREWLLSKDADRRAKAETALLEITDPRAVPVVWESLAVGDPQLQLKAVEVLGQIDGPAASRAIAAIAVLSPFANVRGTAIDTAERRDPRDFLDSLLPMIHRPFTYKIQPVTGPGSEGGLFVEGERFNIKKIYQVEPIDPRLVPPRLFSPEVPFDPFNATNIAMMMSAQPGATVNLGAGAANVSLKPGRNGQTATNATDSANAVALAIATQGAAVERDQLIAQRLERLSAPAREAQQNLAQDIQTVESWNQGIREMNDRVLPVARAVTGRDYGTDRDTWLSWWNDQLGYMYQSTSTQPKPTYTQVVQYASPVVSHGACFVAGTPVHTMDGERPIEKLQVGDQVLSQNSTTGALSFLPVLAIHHNEPSPTLKLRLEGETVVATGIHRFWKVGKGWTMARDLKPGDTLRVTGGTSRLESVEPGPTEPVYNLDVAENRDFFVGRRGYLVHDFSVVQPVMEPFDRVSE